MTVTKEGKTEQNKPTFIKRFLEWIGVKERLDTKEYKPPFVKEGEIWWAHIGENIGVEVCGKGAKFARPVLIYKKLSGHAFLAIPLTTKQKEGTWYVSFMYRGISQVAVLSQIRVLSVKRLDNMIGQIDDTDFTKVKEGFKNLYT